MYCTIENIEDLVPATILNQLTGGNFTLISKAIEDAQSTINAYLQGAYNLNEISNLPLLTDISQKISVYNLYSRFSADETPQIVSHNYNIAISELEKIQSGKLSLGISDGSAQARQSEVLSNKSASSKFFSDTTMVGF